MNHTLLQSCASTAPLRRRRCLAFGLAASLVGCALTRGAPAERIVDLRSGRDIDRESLRQRLLDSDVALLGELHDNVHHHARRGELLASFGRPVTVVAEHLSAGTTAALRPGLSGGALREALEAAGFDARGWQWPLHEPLFAALARAGHTLVGGNLERDVARRIAREGEPALPLALRTWTEAAPLVPSARRALDDDLRESHCGQLPAARLPGMAAAQRGRDASMAQALVDALDRSRPAVLLAGNGHVRRDYGVPQLLQARRADLRTLSVGFLEAGMPLADAAGLHDVAWIAEPVRREDPCKAG